MATWAVSCACSRVSFAALALNWRRARESDVLQWVAFAYLALSAERNVGLFAVVAAPMLVRNANELLDRRPLRWPAASVLGASVAALLALLTLDVVQDRFFRRLGLQREAGLGIDTAVMPIRAVDWIAQQRPPGPICNSMGTGAYLIWRLYPDYKVLLDGRGDIYGPERYEQLTLTGPERFAELDARYDFGVVLFHYLDPTPKGWPGLKGDEWRLVHRDDVAQVYVRVREP